MKIELTPIAFVSSSFKEKFATPRQPGLVKSAVGKIEFLPPFNNPEAVLGLENCSHIWLQFVFHECMNQGWKPKVRPPRLGGNKKMGVFTTRATHRPNALGLSVVKLDQITTNDNRVVLYVSGLDLIDGTPILDIKPYIPYSDSLPEASYPFAQDAPQLLPVKFESNVEPLLSKHPNLKLLIEEVLAQDPKPAFHAIDENRTYGAHLENVNVQWVYKETEDHVCIHVTAIDFHDSNGD